MDQPAIALTAPRLDEQDIEAAVRVMRSGRLAQGPEVASFEDEFSTLVDGREAVAVASGTAALWLSLLALGIGPGDEVIAPSFTFAATVGAVRLTGATPVFADIDPATYCLDPDAAAAAITPRTAGIIPVDLYGHPAALDRLGALAERHHLALIEDAAQAIGARLDACPTGAFGTVGTFSFYPTKNIQAIEGGMITTGDAALARRLRLLRNHGMPERYQHEIVGTNARMNDVSAAIGRSQLRRLPEITARRRAHAARLGAALAGLPGLTVPTTAPGAQHAWHQYTVRISPALGGRDQLAAALGQAGIGTAVHYPVPLHRTAAFEAAVFLPHTDTAAAQVLSLPIHPALITTEIDRITAALTARHLHLERAA